MQVADATKLYGSHIKDLRIAVVGGGMPYGAQLKALSRRVDVLVATPGRLIDHLQAKRVNLSTVHTLVLDEADRMLDMGFIEDIETIVGSTPKDRQTLLFSATLEGTIARLAAKMMRDPQKIEISGQKEKQSNITQSLLYDDNNGNKMSLSDHLQQMRRTECRESMGKDVMIIIYWSSDLFSSDLARMLYMGFIEDIETIVGSTPKDRQTLLFSATLEGTIARLAAKMMRDPQKIEISGQKEKHSNITQSLLYADDNGHKMRLLDHLLRDANMEQAIVFTATKRDADDLADRLSDQGFAAAALHGRSDEHTSELQSLIRISYAA